MDPWLWIIIVMIILASSSFFVLAEFSIVKVRQSQLLLKANKGNKTAKIAYKIVTNLDKYLSATQLAITSIGLLMGWIGQDTVIYILKNIFSLFSDGDISWLDIIAFPLAFFFLTFIQILFGELIPKNIAIKNPLMYTMIIAWPLQIFYWIFYPIIWLLQFCSLSMLKIMGIKDSGKEVHTEEEIKLFLTESEEGGVIGEASNELIQNVFEFDDQTVRQIYVPRSRIYAIDIDEDFDTHIDTITIEGYSRIPVYKGTIDNIVGIVYLKDFLPAFRTNANIDLNRLIRPAHFVPQNQKIEQLLKDFQRLHIQMAIVTNEHGETAGIVTLEDIVEELVWEIQDEHDTEEATVIEKRPGTYVIRTESTIDDVNDALPFPLPESPDYDTVSGFINTLFGRIPNAGETIEYEDYDITVLRRGKNTVELIKMQVQK